MHSSQVPGRQGRLLQPSGAGQARTHGQNGTPTGHIIIVEKEVEEFHYDNILVQIVERHLMQG